MRCNFPSNVVISSVGSFVMEREAGLLAELAPVLDGGHVGCPVNVLQPLGGVRRYEELVSEEGGFIKSFVL